MTLHTGSGLRVTEQTILAAWRDWFDPSINQGSLDVVTVPSAARAAATYTTANLIPPMWARGLVLYVNITNANGGTLTVTAQGVDPVGTTNVYTILASAGLTANGLTALKIYPGLTAVANSVASDIVPALWNINHVVATATMTYSIGYSYEP
jgi:hypothetical protein